MNKYQQETFLYKKLIKKFILMEIVEKFGNSNTSTYISYNSYNYNYSF